MLSYIKKSFNNIRIKRKILILFIIGIFLPMVILSILFLYQIRTALSHQEDILVRNELTRIQFNINEMMDTSKNLASTYFSDKDLAWALETYSNDSMDSIEVIRNINSKILSDEMINPFIENIKIYFENKNLFETENVHLINTKIKQIKWYEDFYTSKKSTYLGIQKGIQNNNQNSSIFLIQKLNVLRYESGNFIKMDLSPDIIRANFVSKLLSKKNSGIYLVNSSGQIAVSNLKNTPKMFSSINIKPREKLYMKTFEKNSILNGWSIKVISQRSILYSGLSDNIRFFLASFFIIVLISILMFYGLAHSIIIRLEYMAEVMEQSKNDELKEIDTAMGNDEIGITAMRYNSIIQRIKYLIGQNVKANDELQAANEELTASINEIESREKEINELIYIDKLTGLANRFAITSFIDRKIIEMNGKGNDENFSIGFLDIDNFKLINDTYGHDVGDEIIKQTGLRLKNFESDSIHVGRFGGDEFIVTVRGFKDIGQLNSINENIRVSLRQKNVIKGITFSVTISMGVSLFAVHSKKRDELIKMADIALYKAKEYGRDLVVVFENKMNQALSEKLVQQELVREAIKNKQFILHYQPYYDAKTKAMRGCEALIRWKDTCKLNMTPFEVIQCIEEMGLMVDFGFWIFIEGCLFAKKINENRENPIVVSINISALQLMNNSFVDRVLDIIAAYEIDVKYISLEMTETILINSIENGASILHKLRNAGISISLDDFGTGYSSLKYFKELPINALKIDKSFVDNITTNAYDEQLVETMIQLAHSKSNRVIAEGIETGEQFDLLQKMGCDIIQGYLFSKPISEGEMIAKLSQMGER